MKKMILALLFAGCVYGEMIILDNETEHPDPNKHSKIAVQWANSAKDIDEGNQAMLHGLKLNSDNIQSLPQKGKITLTIPQKAQYFRVLIWSNGQGDPDLHTNWVNIIPNKTYTLKNDHLVPTVLMAGTGC